MQFQPHLNPLSILLQDVRDSRERWSIWIDLVRKS
jgi:hypothetical protein